MTAVNGAAGAGVIASGSGDGVVSPFSGTLSGGEDEPFPLNTPVTMAGTTALSRLGSAGTLKQALTEINDQRNALSVIVRVEEKRIRKSSVLPFLRGSACCHRQNPSPRISHVL